LDGYKQRIFFFVILLKYAANQQKLGQCLLISVRLLGIVHTIVELYRKYHYGFFTLQIWVIPAIISIRRLIFKLCLCVCLNLREWLMS